MPVRILKTKFSATLGESPKMMVAVADYGFGSTVDIPLPQHFLDDDYAMLDLLIAEGMENLAASLQDYADQLRTRASGGHRGGTPH